jgi:hypothetical protein
LPGPFSSETRHVKAALSAMAIKTDRDDARGIAQLLRLGWFKPVHAKALAVTVQFLRSAEPIGRHPPADRLADGPGMGTRSGQGRSAASASSALDRRAGPFPIQPHDVAAADGRPRTEARSSCRGHNRRIGQQLASGGRPWMSE